MALAIGVAVAALCFLAAGGFKRDSSAAAFDELVALVGESRPTEGRLSGGFEHGPWRANRGATNVDAGRKSPELLITTGTLALAAIRTPTAEHLHRYGVASLVLGELDSAVRALEDASVLDPRQAAIQNDLSVAYLARVDPKGRFDDLIKALNAAGRARRLSPRQPEAAYNLALVLERLHLEARAGDTWQGYLTDAAPAAGGWMTEARHRLDSLLAGSGPPASLANIFAALDAAIEKDDEEATKAVVERHPDGARTYLEERVSERWAAIASDRPDDRARLLRHAAAIAASSVFGDDRQPQAIVDWLRDTPHAPALADALRRLAASAALVRDDRYTDVPAAMGSAADTLEQSQSPLAPIAEYYALMPSLQRGDIKIGGPRLAGLEGVVSQSGYAYWHGVVLNRLGQVRGRDGDLQAAVRLREDAIAAFTAARSDEQIAVMHSFIAEAYRNLGDLSAAWGHHAEALRRLPRIDAHRARHSIIVQVGLTAAIARMWDAGQEIQTAVIANGIDWQRASGVATGYLQRARNRQRAQTFTGAEADLVEAERWLERIPDREFRERNRLEWLEVKGEVAANGQHAAALDALNVVVDRFVATNFGARLPGVLYRRADVYRQLGRTSESIADLQTGLARLEEDRARLSEEQLRVAQSGVLRQLANALADYRLGDSSTRAEAFTLVDLPRAQTLAERLAGNRPAPIDLTQLRQRLPADGVLLHYTLLRDRVLLWEVTHDADRVHTLSLSSTALVGLVQRYRRGLAGEHAAERGGERGYASTARQLGDILFAPVQPAIARARAVVIVPDGYLYGVAFPALPLDATKTLATDHDVLIAPSAAAAFGEPADVSVQGSDGGRAASASTRAALPRDRVLIAGAVPVADGRPPLPWVREEVSRLGRLYPGARVLDGAQATKAAFLASLDRTRILHFAGHADANPERPLLSRLLLMAPDGRADALYGYEIAKRDLRGIVVVLAACSTGFNDAAADAQNEGVLSFARGFLAAGATAVVASLVDVRDAETVPLMVAFHEALAQGAPPAHALRRALAEYRETQPVTGTTWQSFVVIGNRAALGEGS